MKKHTLAIVGCGKLAHLVTDALIAGILPDYELIGAYSRTKEKAESIASKINQAQPDGNCQASDDLDALFALKPQYVVEAASPASLKEIAIRALKNGSSIITLSIGALADEQFYEEVKSVAAANNTKVYIASGAVGGFDVLRTAALMGSCEGSFSTEKGPNSLRNTPVYQDSLQNEKQQVFAGNAIEAIDMFPTRVNVAVAASLASVGPKQMKVTMKSTPGFVGDRHIIEVKNDEVHAVVDIYSKTAKIAGWSVVNTLRNITSPIVF